MYKVVIADDNALSVKGLLANLDMPALNAEIAGFFLSAMDVLAYLKKHPDVDLIISDIRMPHMTGLELAREALKINKLVKIVLISAYDDFEYAQEALRIGVFDYVQKPIQYDALAEIMRKALERLEEERKIQKRLEEAQPLLLDKFYTDLMHTHSLLAESILSQRAGYLNVPVSGGSFLCVAIVSEANEQEEPLDNVEKNLLQMLSMIEDLHEHFQARFHCHTMSERDHILLLLHAPHRNRTDMTAEVVRACKEFDASQKGEDIRICFGIGLVVDVLWDITRSVDSALHSANKHFIFPDQTVFVDNTDETFDLAFISRLSETETEIVRLLLQRNTEELNRVVRQLVENCQSRLKDGMIAMSFIYVLASVILGQFTQDHLELSEASKLLMNFGSRTRHTVSANEMYDFLMRFFALIISELSHSQQSYQQQLMSSLKSYIEEHLHDAQLRLEGIAAHVHMHPSHLSRMFKKLEDINVSDFITNKRIQRAEKLLLSTDHPVALISEQVGYSSPYYFSACFKKLTGKTPSEYRRNPKE